MVYYLNKIVGFFLSPMMIGVMGVALGLALRRFAWRKTGVACLSLGVLWLWFWSTGLSCGLLATALEGPWVGEDGRVKTVESYPTADLIVCLSGGMSANTNFSPYGELHFGSDRVRWAAKLFAAGKAPRVVLTGLESRESSLLFLRELGVPESAVLIDNDSQNTEENAAFTARLLAKDGAAARPRVLLVTSAWHMRRALLMFRKYAPSLDVVPSPADFEMLATRTGSLSFEDFLPGAGALGMNSVYLKELVGYWGYRLLR